VATVDETGMKLIISMMLGGMWAALVYFTGAPSWAVMAVFGIVSTIITWANP
jgi:hypothetical protein